jgi:hypothetical protein
MLEKITKEDLQGHIADYIPDSDRDQYWGRALTSIMGEAWLLV